MNTRVIRYAGFTVALAVAACNQTTTSTQPKVPGKKAETPPEPSKPKVVMGAPRLCSGQQLISKLVAKGPLPPVDEGTKPGVLNASLKGAKGDGTFQKAYEGAAPKIVYIVSAKKSLFGFSKSSGTGALIDDKGHIITNFHVVSNGKQDDFSFKVNVFFGKMEASGRIAKEEQAHEGTIVKIDPIRDLAVIKVNDVPKGVGFMKLADKDPKPGQPVAAIGHGNIGLLWSVKGCTVASIGERKDLINSRGDCEQYVDDSMPSEGRMATVDRCKKDLEDANKVLGDQVGGQGLMVQTDCGISHGDSGGPLIDETGGLVGINQGISVIQGSADNGRHIHVGEVREFVQKLSDVPAHELPNPWCAGLDNSIEDVDLDGQVDLERAVGGANTPTSSTSTKTPSPKRPAARAGCPSTPRSRCRARRACATPGTTPTTMAASI
jgi:S1-C subfamily serine protease